MDNGVRDESEESLDSETLRAREVGLLEGKMMGECSALAFVGEAMLMVVRQSVCEPHVAAALK